jgi:ABC-type anion transport system duplicated permease subunit
MAEERGKKVLMIQVIAAALAVIILVIWLANLKNVWRDTGRQGATSSEAQWSDLKNNLNTTLTNVQSQLSRLQEVNQVKTQATNQAFLDNLLKKTQANASSTEASSTAPAVAATSTVATSSPPAATSSPIINNTNCPKYINCMPSTGAARPCQIPAGCEKITQKVY